MCLQINNKKVIKKKQHKVYKVSQVEGLTFSFQKHLLFKYINFNILTSPELLIYM